MTLTERIDKLEDAHRALAAQHLALQSVCRVMLPLIGANPALLRKLLQTIYDTSTALMQAHAHDDEFQAEVQHWLDVLSGEIFAAANKYHRRPNQR